MNEHQKFLLDKTISRIDFYINSINSKASFYIAFNTFIIGAIILRYSDIVSKFSYPKIQYIIPLILLIIAIGCFLSIYFVIMAVTPYLKSGNQPSSYHSLLFFGSIAEMELDVFMNNIKDSDDTKLQDDLARQVHVLSVGLSSKFKNISKSTFCITYFVLLPIGALALCQSIDWFIK